MWLFPTSALKFISLEVFLQLMSPFGNMNDKSATQETSFRTFQLMNEQLGDENLPQRELVGWLGIAVGLVHSYLKNLAAKGFLRIKNNPCNRYAYLLTTKGFAGKSCLAYRRPHYFNNLCRSSTERLSEIFSAFEEPECDGCCILWSR